MPNPAPVPAPPIDASPVVSAKETPPPQDGWRVEGVTAPTAAASAAGPDLAALRAKLDHIDDAVHDLLIERATIVEAVARSGKPAAFRPGREASIVRRLVRRHHGSLPPVTLFRVWRELLAGTTAMQGGFSLAVSDASSGAELTQLAREHFGALTPLRRHGDAEQALADVSQGTASVAVLPFPSDVDPWWDALLRHEPRLYVIGRLPFWRDRSVGAPAVQALVVAASSPDASGDDRSLIALECDRDIGPTRLVEELNEAGLGPVTLVLSCEGKPRTNHFLVEIDGYFADDDVRLGRFAKVLGQPVVLGGYAQPFAETIR